MFAFAVLTVALPSLALAGEPVPMSDSDLDAVAAGASIKNLTQAIAAIRAHPADFQKLAAENKAIYFANQSRVKAALPQDLWHLLPTN
jgi:hypothetical protein